MISIREGTAKVFDAYIKKSLKNTLINEKNKEGTIKYQQHLSIEQDEIKEKGYYDINFQNAEEEIIKTGGFIIHFQNEKLYEAIKMMSRKYQVALILSIVYEMKIADIAKILNISTKTVKNYKKHAKRKVMELLNEKI